MLWICGSVLSVVFGTCAGWAGLMAIQPMSKVERWLKASGAPNAEALLQQFGQLAPHLPTIAATLAVLGFLPGVAYLILGFPVRRGRRAPAITAFVLSGTQTLVAGLMLVGGLLAAMIAASPLDMTLVVLTWGSLTGLLTYTAWRLLRVIRGNATSPNRITSIHEPWDQE